MIRNPTKENSYLPLPLGEGWGEGLGRVDLA